MKNLGIGIDFGTTNSLAAVWGRDVIKIADSQRTKRKPVAFWNDDLILGNRPHPSIVWYRPDNSVSVGLEARKKMQELDGTMGHSFIRSIKRSLLDGEHEHGGKRMKPFEIASEVFSHLRNESNSQPTLHGHKFEECVVTVPVAFSGEERRVIRRAMERAGLTLQTFVHEPFAAMVAHFYDSETKLASLRGKRVLVFDWGGGTLDVCLSEGADDGTTLYELSHDGIEDRAGDDFDRNLMKVLRNRFLEKNQGVSIEYLEANFRAQDRFWLESELGKIQLSEDDRAQVRVPEFLEGDPPFDLSEKITKEEFESIIELEVEAAIGCALRCVRKARLTPESVDHVLMVGGSSLIPLVRRKLEEKFGAKVETTDEPDAAIARGAAIVAAEEWQPVNAITIGSLMTHETFFPFLNRDEPLVASNSKKYVFYCTDPRDGVASFIFGRQPVLGDSRVEQFGKVLQVPVKTDRPSEFKDLDRLLASITVTKDATLLVDIEHTGNGGRVSHEISDISFGLKLS